MATDTPRSRAVIRKPWERAVQDKIREWMGEVPWRVRLVALLVIMIALPFWAVDALIQAWDDYTDSMRETWAALRTGKPPK